MLLLLARLFLLPRLRLWLPLPGLGNPNGGNRALRLSSRMELPRLCGGMEALLLIGLGLAAILVAARGPSLGRGLRPARAVGVEIAAAVPAG